MDTFTTSKTPDFEGNYMDNFEDRKDFEFYPGDVKHWWRKDWRFYFQADDTTLEVMVLSDRIFRFRFSVYESFEDDFSYAVPKFFESSATNIIFSETDQFFSISTNQVKCYISKKGLRTRLTNAADEIMMEDEKGYHWLEEKNHGGYIVINTNKLESDDQFYGLGDKSNLLNLRGKKFQLWGVDHYGYGPESDPVYKNIPFFIGLRNGNAYGVFFDNTFRSFFDFGQERENAFSFWAHGGEMRFYYIYGPDATEVSEQYTYLTGRPELPPMWALGYQQSKWSYYPESVVRNLGHEFRNRQIPCDVIHLDIDYMDG
jgi:alpha-glucosidase